MARRRSWFDPHTRHVILGVKIWLSTLETVYLLCGVVRSVGKFIYPTLPVSFGWSLLVSSVVYAFGSKRCHTEVKCVTCHGLGQLSKPEWVHGCLRKYKKTVGYQIKFKLSNRPYSRCQRLKPSLVVLNTASYGRRRNNDVTSQEREVTMMLHHNLRTDAHICGKSASQAYLFVRHGRGVNRVY